MKIYKQKDLDKFKEIIEVAKIKWRAAAKAVYEKEGDTGSCIVGDGIEILLVPPRCRKPRTYKIISSSEIALCQGSLHYEATKNVALDFLKENGIDAKYNYGWMD